MRAWLRILAIDARALSLCRIAVGLLVLTDLAMRAPGMDFWSGPDNLYPVAVARGRFPLALSIHTLSDAAWFQWTLFAAAALFAVLLVVGAWSRTSALASWYLLVSLGMRDFFMTNVGDTALSLLLFWLIFLPGGSRYSLDERRRRARGFASPARVESIAAVGVLVQMAGIVLFSVYWKSTGTTWFAGTALQWAVSDDAFSRPLGDWLLTQPTLSTLITYGTLTVETLGPVALIFTPLRWQPVVRPLAMLAMACFFSGIGLGIQLGLIPFIMLTSLVLFTPSGLLDRILGGEQDPGLPPPPDARPGFVRTGIPAAVLGIVLFLNLDGMLLGSRVSDGPVGTLFYQLNLSQGWSMFAPDPRLASSRLIFVEADAAGAIHNRAFGARRDGWPELPTDPVLERAWDDLRVRIHLHDVAVPPPNRPALLSAVRWYCRHAEGKPARVKLQKVVRRPRVQEPDAEIRSVLGTRTLVPFVDCGTTSR